MRAIFLFFLFISLPVFSQNIHFIKSYGNTGYDFGKDIKQTLDTGYIATGSSSSFSTGTADAFLLKVDSLGNFKWSYSYGGLGSDWGEKVVLTKDSAFALGGYTNSFGFGGFDFYLVKTDINGLPEWEKTYGGSDWDKGYGLVQLPDSGYVMVGETFSFGAGNSDAYIVRTDKNGDTLWTKTWGGAENDIFKDVAFDGDSLIAVGSTESFGAGGQDGLMVKYSIDGTIGWERIIGGGETDFFNSVMVRDTFYMAGGSRSYHHFADCDCSQDFWLYKITNDADSVLADTTWNGTQFGVDIVNDISLNPNNDMFYSGSTTSWGSVDIAEGKSDAFMGRLLNNYYTAFDYVNNFGEQYSDEVSATDFCYDWGLVGIGTMKFSSTGGYNIFIVRNDKNNSWPAIDVATDLENEIITLSNEEIIKETLKIYPTLVEDFLTISNFPDQKEISIFQMDGGLVFTSSTTDNVINATSLTTGFYILQVNTAGKIYTTKFFKQ